MSTTQEIQDNDGGSQATPVIATNVVPLLYIKTPSGGSVKVGCPVTSGSTLSLKNLIRPRLAFSAEKQSPLTLSSSNLVTTQTSNIGNQSTVSATSTGLNKPINSYVGTTVKPMRSSIIPGEKGQLIIAPSTSAPENIVTSSRQPRFVPVATFGKPKDGIINFKLTNNQVQDDSFDIADLYDQSHKPLKRKTASKKKSATVSQSASSTTSTLRKPTVITDSSGQQYELQLADANIIKGSTAGSKAQSRGNKVVPVTNNKRIQLKVGGHTAMKLGPSSNKVSIQSLKNQAVHRFVSILPEKLDQSEEKSVKYTESENQNKDNVLHVEQSNIKTVKQRAYNGNIIFQPPSKTQVMPEVSSMNKESAQPSKKFSNLPIASIKECEESFGILSYPRLIQNQTFEVSNQNSSVNNSKTDSAMPLQHANMEEFSSNCNSLTKTDVLLNEFSGEISQLSCYENVSVEQAVNSQSQFSDIYEVSMEPLIKDEIADDIPENNEVFLQSLVQHKTNSDSIDTDKVSLETMKQDMNTSNNIKNDRIMGIVKNLSAAEALTSQEMLIDTAGTSMDFIDTTSLSEFLLDGSSSNIKTKISDILDFDFSDFTDIEASLDSGISDETTFNSQTSTDADTVISSLTSIDTLLGSQSTEEILLSSQSSDDGLMNSQTSEENIVDSQTNENTLVNSHTFEDKPVNSKSIEETEISSKDFDNILISSHIFEENEVDTRTNESDTLMNPTFEGEVVNSQTIEKDLISSQTSDDDGQIIEEVLINCRISDDGQMSCQTIEEVLINCQISDDDQMNSQTFEENKVYDQVNESVLVSSETCKDKLINSQTSEESFISSQTFDDVLMDNLNTEESPVNNQTSLNTEESSVNNQTTDDSNSKTYKETPINSQIYKEPVMNIETSDESLVNCLLFTGTEVCTETLDYQVNESTLVNSVTCKDKLVNSQTTDESFICSQTFDDVMMDNLNTEDSLINNQTTDDTDSQTCKDILISNQIYEDTAVNNETLNENLVDGLTFRETEVLDYQNDESTNSVTCEDKLVNSQTTDESFMSSQTFDDILMDSPNIVDSPVNNQTTDDSNSQTCKETLKSSQIYVETTMNNKTSDENLVDGLTETEVLDCQINESVLVTSEKLVNSQTTDESFISSQTFDDVLMDSQNIEVSSVNNQTIDDSDSQTSKETLINSQIYKRSITDNQTSDENLVDCLTLTETEDCTEALDKTANCNKIPVCEQKPSASLTDSAENAAIALDIETVHDKSNKISSDSLVDEETSFKLKEDCETSMGTSVAIGDVSTDVKSTCLPTNSEKSKEIVKNEDFIDITKDNANHEETDEDYEKDVKDNEENIEDYEETLDNTSKSVKTFGGALSFEEFEEMINNEMIDEIVNMSVTGGLSEIMKSALGYNVRNAAKKEKVSKTEKDNRNVKVKMKEKVSECVDDKTHVVSAETKRNSISKEVDKNVDCHKILEKVVEDIKDVAETSKMFLDVVVPATQTNTVITSQSLQSNANNESLVEVETDVQIPSIPHATDKINITDLVTNNNECLETITETSNDEVSVKDNSPTYCDTSLIPALSKDNSDADATELIPVSYNSAESDNSLDKSKTDVPFFNVCGDISENSVPSMLHCDTTTAHCNTTTAHCDTTTPHCDTTTPHCDTTMSHSDTSTLHCDTATSHCDTAVFIPTSNDTSAKNNELDKPKIGFKRTFSNLSGNDSKDSDKSVLSTSESGGTAAKLMKKLPTTEKEDLNISSKKTHIKELEVLQRKDNKQDADNTEDRVRVSGQEKNNTDPMNFLEWKDGIGHLPGSNLKFRVNEFGLIEIVEDEDYVDLISNIPDEMESFEDVEDLDLLDTVKIKEEPEEYIDIKEELIDVKEELEEYPIIKKEAEDFMFESVEADTVSAVSSAHTAGLNEQDDVSAEIPGKTDEILCCNACSCYGLLSEFYNSSFCSEQCSLSLTIKKEAVEQMEKMQRKEKQRNKNPIPTRLTMCLRQLVFEDENIWETGPKKRTSLQKIRLKKRKRRLFDMLKIQVDQYKASANAVGTISEHVGELFKKIKGEKDDNEETVEEEEKVTSITTCSKNSLNEVLPSVNTSGAEQSPVGSREESSNITSLDQPQINEKFPLKQLNVGPFWPKYLEYCKAEPASINLFQNPFPLFINGFEVGMKMEGIDPKNPKHFCVLTVAEVKGFRIKLHIDGVSEDHDFWVNADYQDIFPVGWCKNNNRKLQPPKDYLPETFFWGSYLKMCGAIAAPESLFGFKPNRSDCLNKFRVGMKLEAMNMQMRPMLCVATVADTLDNRILVSLDGWDDTCDYWVDVTSPYIHPVGWCRKKRKKLHPPKGMEPETFSWKTYLEDTNSVAAPASAFKEHLDTNRFQVGTKLECVDPRTPSFIRVATITKVKNHWLKISFDGWPSNFSVWMEDDSSDIHPIGWCYRTKHRLELPLVSENKEMADFLAPFYNVCDVIVKSEPPSEDLMEGQDNKNITKGSKPDVDIGRRLVKCRTDQIFKRVRDNISSGVKDDEEEQWYSRKRYKWRRTPFNKSEDSFIGGSLHNEWLNTYIDYKEEDAVKSDGKPYNNLWAKHSVYLHKQMVHSEIYGDPNNWTAFDVSSYVESIPGCRDVAEKFETEAIDGEAFLCLDLKDITDVLGCSLGPAIKIYNSIVLLKNEYNIT